MVPANESPSYPGFQLCEDFLLRKGDKMRGPRRTVLIRKILLRIYCTKITDRLGNIENIGILVSGHKIILKTQIGKNRKHMTNLAVALFKIMM